MFACWRRGTGQPESRELCQACKVCDVYLFERVTSHVAGQVDQALSGRIRLGQPHRRHECVLGFSDFLLLIAL